MSDDDAPTTGKAVTLADFMSIVSHPAFRIGFLDAQHDRPFDHDHIVRRIQTETPPNALKRLGWDGDLFSRDDVALAQYRYEEGRMLAKEYGLRCRAWGHPDFPPKQVFDFIWDRAEKRIDYAAVDAAMAEFRAQRSDRCRSSTA